MCAPDLRKRTAAMALRDASADEEEDAEETPKTRKFKKRRDKEDEGNNSDSKSEDDDGRDDYVDEPDSAQDEADDVQIEDDVSVSRDEVDEEEPAKERKASGRRMYAQLVLARRTLNALLSPAKPRPAYKGKATQEVDDVEMEEAGGDEDVELEERERKLARNIGKYINMSWVS